MMMIFRGREAPDALKVRGLNIPRLGIDKNIVKWLQENGYSHLTEKELLEEYTPENRKYLEIRWLSTNT